MAVNSGGGTSGSDLTAAAQAFAQSLANGSTAASSGQVYMGSVPYAEITGQNPDYLQPMAQSQMSRRTTARWVSTDEALGEFYTWKPKQQDDFLAKLKVAGLVQQDAGAIEAGKIWQALVGEAANYGAQGQPVSPMDILGGYVSAAGGMTKGQWKGDGSGRFEVNALTGERRYIGPQFSTQTNQRIDMTDPATARAIATKMFQDLMGRNPGKGEIGSFATALSSAEASNPTTETTTTQYDTTTGDAIGTNTVASGGVSADAKAMLASDQIKGKAEYGATQAATTYMNALNQAVGL